MKPIPLKEWRKRKKGHDGKILKKDSRIKDALVDLRDFVENLNKAPKLAYRNGIYRGIGNEDIQTVKVDGVEVGYQLQDKGAYVRRRIFIKILGYDIGEIPQDQIDPICAAVMDALLDHGQSMPKIARIARDCLYIEQDFIPLTLKELKPGIVTPGKKG